MTDYATLCASIAEWANRQDWPQTLLDTYVLMAQEKFNADLRIDRMINTAQNTVTCSCSTLPDDWLEMDLLMISSPNAPSGWQPLRYKARDEFFRLPATPFSGTYLQNYNSTWGAYTLEGRTIWFGGPPDETEGRLFQMNYYQEVPVMASTGTSWVYTKFPKLYLFASLMNANFHAVGEEQTALILGQQVDQQIAKLNADHRYARASGSRLARSRVRSFG